MRAHAISSLLDYAWRANTIFDVHAPKAFSFVGEVVEDTREFYAFAKIEAERKRLLADPTEIQLTDHGAGSRARTARRKTVAQVARQSTSPPRFGRYLFRVVEWAQAQRVLELGTNLGIGTAYLAAPLPGAAKLVSIEGDPAVLAQARITLDRSVGSRPVRLLEGTFEARLEEALAELGHVDVTFIDGHHAEEATKRYFARIAEACHPGSVVVLDDIYWSPGMAAAWRWVREQPGVTLSLDLYRWGVVFFDDKILRPQHLTIAPSAWKPWHMGFFTARGAGH